VKKKVVLIITGIVFLAGSVFLFPSLEDESRELYIKAVSEQNPGLKIRLLKQYEQKYGQEQDNYSKFIYIQLADTSFKVKDYDEAIRYGEQALGFEDIAPTNKLLLFSVLANSFYVSQAQKNLQKSYDYAGSMIELAKWAIDKAKNSNLEANQLTEFEDNYNAYYIAPAFRIQAMVLFSRGKEDAAAEDNTIKEAAQKALDAYMLDKSEHSSRLVISLAGYLFQKDKLDDAAAVVEKIFDETSPDDRLAGFLGTVYSRKGEKDKAVHYFELAYKTHKKVNTAMAIGQLVYKKDIDKGIQYFADAFVLSHFDENSRAFQYLRELYYNRKAKDVPAGEKEKGFKEIINAARVRIGVEEGKEETAAE
jgi:tetratricopeptide (TPR) repeat protein